MSANTPHSSSTITQRRCESVCPRLANSAVAQCLFTSCQMPSYASTPTFRTSQNRKPEPYDPQKPFDIHRSLEPRRLTVSRDASRGRNRSLNSLPQFMYTTTPSKNQINAFPRLSYLQPTSQMQSFRTSALPPRHTALSTVHRDGTSYGHLCVGPHYLNKRNLAAIPRHPTPVKQTVRSPETSMGDELFEMSSMTEFIDTVMGAPQSNMCDPTPSQLTTTSLRSSDDHSSLSTKVSPAMWTTTLRGFLVVQQELQHQLQKRRDELKRLDKENVLLACCIVDLLDSQKDTLPLDPQVCAVIRHVILTRDLRKHIALVSLVPRYLASAVDLVQSKNLSTSRSISSSEEAPTISQDFNTKGTASAWIPDQSLTSTAPALLEPRAVYSPDSPSSYRRRYLTMPPRKSLFAQHQKDLSIPIPDNFRQQPRRIESPHSTPDQISPRTHYRHFDDHSYDVTLSPKRFSPRSITASPSARHKDEYIHTVKEAKVAPCISPRTGNDFDRPHSYHEIHDDSSSCDSYTTSDDDDDDDQAEEKNQDASTLRKPFVYQQRLSRKPPCVPQFRDLENVGTSGWLSGDRTAGEFIPADLRVPAFQLGTP